MSVSQHVRISIVGDGENMWRHFILSLATVDTNNVVIVYGEPLVWIDSDTEETRVSVNHESLVSLIQFVDDSSFREIGHVCQIFQKFVFWRVLEFDFRFLKKIIEFFVPKNDKKKQVE